MTFQPGQNIGRYQIVGLLGAGGMGEVYRARDLTLKRDIAIKGQRFLMNTISEVTAGPITVVLNGKFQEPSAR